MFLTSNYRMKPSLWIDAFYTAVLFFTGMRAHEWVTKIKIKHVVFLTVREKDMDNNIVVSKVTIIYYQFNKNSDFRFISGI